MKPVKDRVFPPFPRCSAWYAGVGLQALRLSLIAVAIWPAAAAAQPRITFNKDIAPIVWARCASCHRPGEIGPFNLLTYDDVRKRATQIAAVTSRRIMPPWKAAPVEGGFRNERRLTEHELAAMLQWIAGGAPEGEAADLPPRPDWNDGWQLGTPDLVVRMADTYTIPAEGGDLFRTFVIPIPLLAARYVRALELRPGNARVVHHANLGIDRTRSSRQLDARDPAPGYAGSMERDARYPEGHLLGWTPGQTPHPVPDGTQWRLEAASDLVVQLHLQPTGKPEQVQVSVGLFFADAPPVRAPITLRLGSQTIDIPPGAHDHLVSDSYRLPVDAEVLAVQPHAHNLARRMEANALLPDGTTRSLISIADWDFRWQDVYRYAVPFVLPKGTTISMRYAYDNSSGNSRNPHHPPARVVWGQNTSDEMGDFWIQVVPRSSGDAATLTEDFTRKAHAEDLAAYTTLLRREPLNPLRHDAVADLYLGAGQVDQAITAYEESLRLNNDSAPTHYNLGFALSARGRHQEAIAHLREAIRIDPDYALAHNNLGALLQVIGQNDQALSHYRRAAALRPDNLDARTNLGQLLSARGDVAQAAAEFRDALTLKPDHSPALAGLAWIRATASDPALRNADEAVHLAERAASATPPRDLSALDALAAAYASAGRYEEAVRAAQTALDLASAAGQTIVAGRFRQRLELYQKRQPFRMP
jgi:tetratricopeptide (TPR) repeat protein